MVNINQFLKQAQGMQKKMQEMQEEIHNKEFIGQAGGNLVKATMKGNNILTKISIDPSLLKEEEKEILEDLIVAAVNDAKKQIDAESQDLFSSGFSSLGLPPGFKMPF